MRHVTDGELHAYLDGGLDTLPDDRASEVRRHVDRCESCVSRLEEARAIRARADEILGMVAPDVTGMPSLEELRRLAGAPDGAADTTGEGETVPPSGSRPADRRPVPGVPLRRSGLRWAATVLVAVGAGWLWGITGGPGAPPAGRATGATGASEGTGASEVIEEPVAGDRVAAEDASSTSSVSDPVGETAPPDPASAGRLARTRSGAEGAARSEEVRVASDRVREDHVAEGTASSRPVPEPDDPSSSAPARARSDDARASDELSLEDRLAVGWMPLAGAGPDGRPGMAVPESVMALRLTERDGEAGGDVSEAVPGWRPLDTGDRDGRRVTDALGLRRDVSGVIGGARMRVDRDRRTPVEVPQWDGRARDGSIDPGSLTVPGLEVVSVEWTRVAPETTGIRVVQRLVTGGTIELRFGGLTDGSAAPEYLREERLPEGLRQVVVDFRDGWLVARAPLDPEQIRALVALIR